MLGDTRTPLCVVCSLTLVAQTVERVDARVQATGQADVGSRLDRRERALPTHRPTHQRSYCGAQTVRLADFSRRAALPSKVAGLKHVMERIVAVLKVEKMDRGPFFFIVVYFLYGVLLPGRWLSELCRRFFFTL